MFYYKLIFIIISSSIMYFYLHYKTCISIKYIYKDNILVILITSILANFLKINLYIDFIFLGMFVIIIGFGVTMIRFWRTPKRNVSKNDKDIVSPADGNVIYIKKLESNELPISVKNGKISKLEEITKTDLLKTPCWLIGINMTPFDVHKNCSPIDGKITLQKHTIGKFHSLKKLLAETENERNTFVIENDKIKIGIVQIASRKVRRIVVYKRENEIVKKGEIIGMIRFGSQVDVILPITCKIKIKLKQQIYAQKTIIAEL